MPLMRSAALLVVLCVSESAQAQSSDYSFDLTEGAGERFGGVTLVLALTNNGEELTGYSIGVCYPDDLVDVDAGDVVDGAAVQANEMFFHSKQYTSDGFTIAALVDPSEGTPFAADAEYELYSIDFDLVGVGEATIEFCETQGNPDVPNHVLTADGSEFVPVLLDGQIDILDPNAPFSFYADSQTIEYDPLEGVDAITVQLSIEENPANPGFPAATRGFAMGIAHDPEVLTPSAASMLSPLTGLNSSTGPDFFGPNLSPTLGDGVTIGVVYNFEGGVFIEFDGEIAVVEIDYDVDASLLIGNEFGLATRLNWDNGLANPAVVNNVFVGSAQFTEVNFFDAFIEFDVPGKEPTEQFLRGDTNGNGETFGIGDGLFLLNYAFLDGPEPPCMDAADVDDNGTVSALQDAIALLGWAYTNGAPPPSPGPAECGADPTDDGLDCADLPALCE